jgi:hypothetical protein
MHRHDQGGRRQASISSTPQSEQTPWRRLALPVGFSTAPAITPR